MIPEPLAVYESFMIIATGFLQCCNSVKHHGKQRRPNTNASSDFAMTRVSPVLQTEESTLYMHVSEPMSRGRCVKYLTMAG